MTPTNQENFDEQARRSRELAEEEVIGETGGSHLISAGIMVISVAAFLFIVWAAFAKVEERAIALGEIIPSDKLYAIQHLEGGIVDKILVEEGDMVEKDQPVVLLDKASVEAQLDQMLSRRAALKLYVERLTAFAEGRETDLKLVGKEFQALQSANVETLNSQIVAKQSQKDVLLKQIQQKKTEIETNHNSVEGAQKQVELLQEEEQAQKPLMEKGITPKVVYLDVLKSLEQAKAEKLRLQGVGKTLEASINELEQRIIELDARLKKEAFSERSRALGELTEAEDVLSSLEDRMQRLAVTSPVRGIVKQLLIKNVRGVIPAGGLIAEVLPVDEPLIIEARVNTRDIGFVQVGQKAQVKVQTYDFTRYGMLEGKVESLSATTFLDKEGIPYYRVKISLDKNHLGEDETQHRVLPGMTVQADIVTGEKTILDYILKPIYLVAKEGFKER